MSYSHLNQKYPLSERQLRKIDKLIDYCCWEYRNILQVSLTFYASTQATNIDFQRFMEGIQKLLISKHIRMEFLWLNSKSTWGGQFFHTMFVIDGYKAQNPKGVLFIAERCWKKFIDDGSESTVTLNLHHRGNVFGTVRKWPTTRKDVLDTYEELTENVLALTKNYRRSETGENDFGLSRMGSKNYGDPLIRLNDRSINMITGEVKRIGMNLHKALFFDRYINSLDASVQEKETPQWLMDSP
jgi:hypothetical protein